MICHLWQQYVTIALLPLANSAVTLRREMGIFNNQTISRIEGAVNGMLEKVADSESYYFYFYFGEPWWLLIRATATCNSDYHLARLPTRKAKEERLQTQERRPLFCTG